MLASQIPLSLYIHLPWCIKKCPYCDFNSYTQKGELPEKAYIEALIADLEQDLPLIHDRPIRSIFIGGGTPSLFSPQAIQDLFTQLYQRLTILPDAEITMEANPGTFEQERFAGFHAAGINRLSLGVQSFHAPHLKKLGRIHGAEESFTAIAAAKKIGFSALNIDIMYGLPQQTLEEAMADLHQALTLKPAHLSWYHLTLEPNTAFYRQPPAIPHEELIEEIETQGLALLAAQQFQQYEVSAYSQKGYQCQHNRNYWEFGDYCGIGAGAHSKITLSNNTVQRFWKHRLPQHYLHPQKSFRSNQQILSQDDLVFEFMLNALRLTEGFPVSLFESRTGLALCDITPILNQACEQQLLHYDSHHIRVTSHGRRFLNHLTGLFLTS